MLKDGEKAKFLVLVLQCKLKVLQKEHIDINIKKVLKVYKGCRHLKKKHHPKKYDWSGSKFPSIVRWKFPTPITDAILKVIDKGWGFLINSDPSRLEGLKNHPKKHIVLLKVYIKFINFP